MKRKMLATITAVILCLSFAACGSSTTSGSAQASAGGSSAAESSAVSSKGGAISIVPPEGYTANVSDSGEFIELYRDGSDTARNYIQLDAADSQGSVAKGAFSYEMYGYTKGMPSYTFEQMTAAVTAETATSANPLTNPTEVTLNGVKYMRYDDSSGSEKTNIYYTVVNNKPAQILVYGDAIVDDAAVKAALNTIKLNY